MTMTPDRDGSGASDADPAVDDTTEAGPETAAGEVFGHPAPDAAGASPDPESSAAGVAPPRDPERVEARFGGVFVEAPGGIFRETVRRDEVVRQEVCNFWARITPRPSSTTAPSAGPTTRSRPRSAARAARAHLHRARLPSSPRSAGSTPASGRSP
jgi:hypothetical protein